MSYDAKAHRQKTTRMFESHVFQSWLSVLIGGVLFAVLFVLVGMMADLVLDGGEIRLTNKALALGLLAFVGYVGVARFLKSKLQD